MNKTLGDLAELLGVPMENIPIVELFNSLGEKIEAKDAEIERLQAELESEKEEVQHYFNVLSGKKK